MHTRSRLLLNLTLLGLGLWSLLSLANVIADTRSSGGGTDFHSYWLSGQYVRQGIDPYSAYIDQLQTDFEITSIDGSPTTLEAHLAEHRGLARVPANTAPLVLLLTLLSFFSWDVAKFIWLGFNLLFILITPWLTRRYVETGGLRLDAAYSVLLALSFWSLLATRVGVGNGQTTAFVLALLLLTLLLRHQDRRLAAGVIFGIALSKYSMALPLLVFLVLAWEFRIILVAALVQFAGLLLLAMIGSSSPATIFRNYIDMALAHTDLPGIHLAHYLPPSTALNMAITLLGLVLMTVVYGVSMRRGQRLAAERLPLISVFQVSAFFMLSLLMNYHRLYDLTMTILPLSLILLAISHRGFFALAQRQVAALVALFALTVAILGMPGTAASVVLPAGMMQTWLDLLGALATISVIALLLGNLWLMNRLTVSQPATVVSTDSG